MRTEKICRRCGAQQPEDGPAGLCPGCLLGLSLDALQPAARDEPHRALPAFGASHPPTARTTEDEFRLSPPAPGVLSDLDRSIGTIPRVLLRDGRPDSAQPVRPHSEEVPSTSGLPSRYQLFGELARGGMGVVLMGRDVDLGREIALKVLLERRRDDPESIRRFIEEAQIGGQLQHPGIIPVHELGRLPDGRLYIAMKLVRGQTLAALLRTRRGPSDDLARFLAVFEQVCQAIAYAHTRGVVHRDLKPSNVMVGSFGEVQVMDWGLAKVLDKGGAADEAPRSAGSDERGAVRMVRKGSEAGASYADAVLGTPAYMAPEQARGAFDTLDERADVFGLGAILCEILTGAPAYAAPTDEAIYHQAARADLADARARLDASDAECELVALARSCLAPAPKDRPRDAGVVLARLTAYLTHVQDRLREAERAQAQAEARAEEEQTHRILADGLAREAEARAAEERKRRILTAVLAGVLLTAALTGAGVWSLTARYRADRTLRTTTEIEEALAGADDLRDRARTAAEYDPALWVEATESARRAELLLSHGEATPALGRRVVDLLASISAEHAQADAAFKDRDMVQRLADIHANTSSHLSRSREDAQYAEAFRDFGIPVDELSPAEAAARIAARPIAIELAGALDHWAFSRRRNRPPRIAEAERLIRVARIADPDPWRNQLRNALDLMTVDRSRARTDLERLAASADATGLTAASAERLAWALADLGDSEAAVALYRAAQRAHPDDFWINSNLASSLVRLERYDEAARFASVAVAIRPRTVHVLVLLGKALQLAGRLDDAEATLRDALQINPRDAGALAAMDAVIKARNEGDAGIGPVDRKISRER
ncbi:protein kinase domain-containing protein [Paludisphaera rhizosphaerae]|uniref:serine/threonine-protein kinase n=1 Tax=Paludisphaera rhizosphaerae TaxID=2711216 RepID=UPI0013EB4A35|nr:serine/threonine-protein kinase [Paludisphaera rhizosphaerae]